ncbi:hypothetical protein MtrunA17_Chr3g0119801 [Medicago truncatula]|uniref:Uncharacterized protein n=1 Tax=Medicago truncatula TaxID=3880 RepID=A0A396ITD7_MEDTR|nr:hypothetical protein MtrunA17_Chr3g0119801 [Medicago truncatula]
MYHSEDTSKEDLQVLKMLFVLNKKRVAISSYFKGGKVSTRIQQESHKANKYNRCSHWVYRN